MQPPLPADLVVRSEGGSMLPLIPPGSLVGIRLVPAADLARGDLAAFRAGGLTVVHRLVGNARPGPDGRLREKGDACSFSSSISPESVVGRAVWVIAAGVERRLDIPASRAAVRMLTALSRVEGAAGDLLAGPGKWLRARLPRLARLLALVPAACLLPLRLAAGPLRLRAYPPRLPDDPHPETVFLLRCLRRALDGRAERERLPPGLDPGLVLAAAETHGLTPLLGRLLAGDAPPPLGGELPKATARAALRHTLAKEQLRAALAALTGASVPCAVLKGPALADDLSGGSFQRVYADLDLLVLPEDREPALAALVRAGYRLETGRVARRLQGRGHFHHALEPPRPGDMPVELHWSLVDRVNLHRIPQREVFARRRAAPADGFGFPTLDREDTFLYLSLHLAKHGIFHRAGLAAGKPAEWFCHPGMGVRLAWFADLHLFLSRHGGSLDWGEVRRRGDAWNMMEELHETLRLLEIMLPGPVVSSAWERLGGRPESAARRSWSPLAMAARSPLLWEALCRSMRMEGSLLFRPARLLVAARDVFPSPGRLRRYYGLRGGLALPWRYLSHPFHLLRKALGDTGKDQATRCGG